jgi:hypothetical protein
LDGIDAARDDGDDLPPGTRAAWSVLALWIAALVAATVTAFAYWPGLMTWDAVHQYGEALSGDFTDWHPPVMQWLWRRLLIVGRGPAPMLLLQLALAWGGLALLASAAWWRARRRLAWALLGCGLLPLAPALTGAVLKDCLMAGALLAATGLIAVRGDTRRPFVTVAAGALLILAATLRFNGFAAAMPLAVALLPAAWRRSAPRAIVATLAATAVLVPAMPLANRLIGARASGVGLSLVIFDLGGITEHSGVDVFPRELGVRGAVAANHRCYRADKWDSYSDWVSPECPLGFTAWNDQAAPAGVRPYATLLHAMLAHPAAYARHRLTHFAINTRLMPLPDVVERPVQVADAPNMWGYRIAPGGVLRALDGFAVAGARTPLGWPALWMALAVGALIAGWQRARAPLIVPLAASSLLYGGSYLVVSVASELRYHLWTELAALIATVLLLAERDRVAGARLAWAYAPALFVIAAGTVLRL